MSRQIRSKYWNEMKYGIKEASWSKWDFLVSFITVFLQSYILYYLFTNLFHDSSKVNSNQFTMYYIIVNIIALSMQPAMLVSWRHMNDINNGTMVLKSMRPYNCIAGEYLRSFACFVLRLLVNMCFIILAFIVLKLEISVYKMFFGVLSVLAGFTILYLIQALIGCLTVWVHDIIRLRDVIMTFLFLLGGRMIPSQYLFSFLKEIIYYTPIPYVYDVPARIMNGQAGVTYLGVQLAWCLVFWAVYEMVFRKQVAHNLEFG